MSASPLSHSLYTHWKQEEECAHIHGWDFSHIDGCFTEDTAFPWDYRKEILAHLRVDMRILDLDTGGGEFLLSLNHPARLTSAAENYGPNVRLCKDTLLPLGIDFRQASAKGPLPWPDESFDLVINRHGDLCAQEYFRVLKKGGLFITQLVGAENDRELVQLLLGDTPLPFPEQTLAGIRQQFQKAGFTLLRSEECVRPIRFTEVGALVWFARIIEWEFPGFCVDTHLPQLMQAQQIIDQEGYVEGHTHRIFLVAQKD